MKAKKTRNKKEPVLKYDEIILKVPLYGGDFGIVATNDKDQLLETRGIDIEDYGDDEIYGHTFMTENVKMQLFLIVLNPYHKEVKLTHGVIAHEAAHVANLIFEYRGIKPDLDNDEPYCYLLEGLVNEVYKFLKNINVRLHLEK